MFKKKLTINDAIQALQLCDSLKVQLDSTPTDTDNKTNQATRDVLVTKYEMARYNYTVVLNNIAEREMPTWVATPSKPRRRK